MARPTQTAIEIKAWVRLSNLLLTSWMQQPCKSMLIPYFKKEVRCT